MSTPDELAANYFRAWMGADAAALSAVLAPDVTFRGPLGAADGRRKCVDSLLALRSGLVTGVDVKVRAVSNHDVLTWFDLHTRVAPPTPTVNWSHVSRGLIDRIRVTFDPRPLLHATAEARPEARS